VVSEPLLPDHFPEFLLFDFLAKGLATLDDATVEAFFECFRIAIAFIRSENTD
jgi:hypothetical protein